MPRQDWGKDDGICREMDVRMGLWGKEWGDGTGGGRRRDGGGEQGRNGGGQLGGGGVERYEQLGGRGVGEGVQNAKRLERHLPSEPHTCI